MNRIRYIADASGGGGKTPSAPTVAELLAETARLNGIINGLQAEKAKNSEREKLVVEKMSHGLSREQAIQVIKRQEEHDAAKAEAANKAVAEKANTAEARSPQRNETNNKEPK